VAPDSVGSQTVCQSSVKNKSCKKKLTSNHYFKTKLEKNKTEILHLVFSKMLSTSALPRNFVQGGGGSTNSVEDRDNGDLGAVNP